MILANLCGSVTGITEAKCLSINPCRSELLAVGANEAFVRIYDRRMIKPQPVRYIDLKYFFTVPSCQMINVLILLTPPGGTEGQT